MQAKLEGTIPCESSRWRFRSRPWGCARIRWQSRWRRVEGWEPEPGGGTQALGRTFYSHKCNGAKRTSHDDALRNITSHPYKCYLTGVFSTSAERQQELKILWCRLASQSSKMIKWSTVSNPLCLWHHSSNPKNSRTASRTSVNSTGLLKALRWSRKLEKPLCTHFNFRQTWPKLFSRGSHLSTVTLKWII